MSELRVADNKPDITNFRPISELGISIKELKPSVVQNFKPELVWVDPRNLMIDVRYQRNLTRKSVNMIKKIISNWSWNSYKPPIVTKYETGEYAVIDGQHTSIAAATHPDIKEIPVLLINSLNVLESAQAFLSHNTDRTPVNPVQLFKAKIEAGDEIAISTNMAIRSAKVRLVNIVADPKVGDCSCINTLTDICDRRGLQALRKILDICVKARLQPINAYYVKGLEQILYGKPLGQRKEFDPDGLANIIMEYPYAQLCADIELQSRAHKKPKQKVAAELIATRYVNRYENVGGSTG